MLINKKSVHSECFIQARSVSCRKGSEICRDVQQFTGKFGLLPAAAVVGQNGPIFGFLMHTIYNNVLASRKKSNSIKKGLLANARKKSNKIFSGWKEFFFWISRNLAAPQQIEQVRLRSVCASFLVRSTILLAVSKLRALASIAIKTMRLPVWATSL